MNSTERVSLSSEIDFYLGHPRVGTVSVVIAPNALSDLRELVAALPEHRVIAILTDTTPFRTATIEDVKALVGEALDQVGEIVWVVLAGDVHADEDTLSVATQGCLDCDVLVTIGSGTLCDIGKVVAADRPHIVIQSAASVNGFADDQSVLLIDGVKRTTQSAWPRSIIVDGRVIQGAPIELNRSGLGDMMSMFTAPADWYLASLVGGDRSWNREAASIARKHGEILLEIAPGIGSNESRALMILSQLTTLSGLSMGVAGQTSPSSGMEHTISHLLDMTRTVRGEPTAYHGAQVGVASVIASIVWSRMFDRMADETIGTLLVPEDEASEKLVREVFAQIDPTGEMGEECWSDYSRKLDRLRSGNASTRVAELVAAWSDHGPTIESLLKEPQSIAEALKAAGAPTTFSGINHPVRADDVVWALANCHLMRNRFTIADLAFMTGWWTETEISSVLDEAATMGAGQ